MTPGGRAGREARGGGQKDRGARARGGPCFSFVMRGGGGGAELTHTVHVAESDEDRRNDATGTAPAGGIARRKANSSAGASDYGGRTAAATEEWRGGGLRKDALVGEAAPGQADLAEEVSLLGESAPQTARRHRGSARQACSEEGSVVGRQKE